MSTIFDARWNNYTVTVRPAHSLRRWVRYRRWYLPFMDNDYVSLVATVARTDKKCTIENMRYTWLIKRLRDNKTFGSGEGLVELGRPISVVSEMIWEPDTYSLDFQLISNGVTFTKTNIMMIPVKDRADITLQYVLPLIISLFTLLLSVGLSILASYITAKIVR